MLRCAGAAIFEMQILTFIEVSVSHPAPPHLQQNFDMISNIRHIINTSNDANSPDKHSAINLFDANSPKLIMGD